MNEQSEADPNADTIIRLIEPAQPTRDTPDARDAIASSPRFLDALPSQARPAPWAVQVRGTSTVVSLDRPVVVGRRPATRVPPGAIEPRRLVIPASFGEVSARHARIEHVGESIVVSDLGSTNGIAVHWASGVVRRLRSGESCVVLPDSTVELAAGVALNFVHPEPPGSRP